jgi:hypothetical protein
MLTSAYLKLKCSHTSEPLILSHELLTVLGQSWNSSHVDIDFHSQGPVVAYSGLIKYLKKGKEGCKF